MNKRKATIPPATLKVMEEQGITIEMLQEYLDGL